MATRTTDLPALHVPAAAILMAGVISLAGWLLLAAFAYGVAIMS